MSDQQRAEFYETLTAAKFAPQRPSHEYPYQRGWNAALDFAIKKMREVCDDPEPPQPDQP